MLLYRHNAGDASGWAEWHARDSQIMRGPMKAFYIELVLFRNDTAIGRYFRMTQDFQRHPSRVSLHLLHNLHHGYSKSFDADFLVV